MALLTSPPQKEDVLNHVKSLALPYTIIDVGWWFQLTLPTSFYDIGYGDLPGTIPGDGNVLSAFTDARDVGKFVARTITDPRTINKSVFCYSEMKTMTDVYNILDRVTGRKFERNYVCYTCHPCRTRHNIANQNPRNRSPTTK
jgi:uncharacterized protein YbjT (DUF2867 family)